MSEEPRYEPARGRERVICWFLIVGVFLTFVVPLFLDTTPDDSGIQLLDILVPGMILLVAIARLKGWVKLGSGGGGGGP